jgi:hypothetical protein
MTRSGTAGRGPAAQRPSPSGTKRSRPRRPAQPAVVDDSPAGGRQTTVTARAAILVLVLASVMVAVALPFKIWLGQRGDIASLVSQTRQTQARLDRLTAQDQKWQNPAYVEAQAKRRLHYAMPGEKTRILLGQPTRETATVAKTHPAVVTGPWYSQLWQSVEAAGKEPASK